MIFRRQPSITQEEFFAQLENGQGERVAFAPAKTAAKTLAETLAAMANGGGGTVFLGVNARGTIQKDNDAEALRKLVDQAGLLAEPPLILPVPQTLSGERGTVLAVQIPPGLPHIYSLHGQYLTRSGAENRQLTTLELRRLLLERGDTGFEAQLAPGATLEDMDEARVVRYLELLSFVSADDVPQALLARGCLGYGATGPRGKGAQDVQLVPTVAGILLFGRNPQQFLRSAEVVCVRYAGNTMGDEFVRQDIGGSLPDQIRQAEAFVMTNMRRGMRIRGFAREDTDQFPIAVVREAIVNAIAHRDYSIRGDGIRLFMFNDRLEIYSPGRLPGHVTLENLVEERYSRNEAIVAVLSDMGYIERLGYGIDRMIATMVEQGLPEPEFAETSAGFKVTLYAAGLDLGDAETPKPKWGHAFLNERQEQALAYVQANGRITNSDYQRLVPDVSAETIRRDLADLVEQNLLLRIGEKRATYYILK
ncbi:MAG: ATP-binding protein [Chloroflexota bacterium]|nr:ATP-binding protein [Chloroflexota bacterium]